MKRFNEVVLLDACKWCPLFSLKENLNGYFCKAEEDEKEILDPDSTPEWCHLEDTGKDAK